MASGNAVRKMGGELVLEALWRFPKTPSLTLAKKLYRDHPAVWKTLDACRGCIRQYRGQMGKKNRANLTRREHIRSAASTLAFPSLPPPIESLEEWQALKVDGPGKWLILSDIQCPFHDIKALRVAMQKGKDANVTGVLLNGDIIDFYRISDYRKDPRKVELAEEVDMAKELLGAIRLAFPKARIIYKLGNHEERYISWMMTKAPELLDIPDFTFASLFGLKSLRIEEVRDKRPIMLGKLWVLHGHEFRRTISAPVNPARGLYLRTGEMAMQGHSHRSSHHGQRQPLSGHMVSCWSTGCLCQLAADYDPLNAWNHGFAIVSIVDREGSFEVENMRIINGKAYT